MRVRLPLLIPTLALVLASSTAIAATPETGVWWNPDEPGTGLQIEIQDNFLAMSGFVFQPDGAPLWVTAQGFLNAAGTRFTSTSTSTDGSWLNTFRNGQCIGCAYPGQPTIERGSQGPVTLDFDPADGTEAILTWGGRSVAIQRFQFYLVRPGDSAVVQTAKMLGEWNVVVDLSQSNEPNASRFFGDVLVIDRFSTSILPPGSTYEGCRPEDALVHACSAQAEFRNDLFGSRNVDTGRNVIVVTSSRDADGVPLDCILYDVKVGSNAFEGGTDGDLDDSNDGGAIFYPCNTGNVFELPAYPVRGYRSASRTLVESNAVR